MGLFGHFRLSLRLMKDRNTLGKGDKLYSVRVCVRWGAC